MPRGREDEIDVSVVVVEPRRFVREALAAALSAAGLRLSAVVESPAGLPAELPGRPPHVVLTGPGVEVLAVPGEARLLALSQGSTGAAAGFDVLHHGLDDLLLAVRDAEHVLPAFLPTAAVPDGPLTPRELEVLREIAAGASARVVAERLGIRSKTVENHKMSIFAKLGVQSQAEAVAQATRAGLLAGSSGRG